MRLKLSELRWKDKMQSYRMQCLFRLGHSLHDIYKVSNAKRETIFYCSLKNMQNIQTEILGCHGYCHSGKRQKEHPEHELRCHSGECIGSSH